MIGSKSAADVLENVLNFLFATTVLSCSTTLALATWFIASVFDSCIESFSFASVSFLPVFILMVEVQGVTAEKIKQNQTN